MAPSASNWCSIALPDRITIGRSGPSGRSASAAAMQPNLFSGFGIGDGGPALAAGLALGEEDLRRPLLLPAKEMVVEAVGIRFERLAGAQAHRAVGIALHVNADLAVARIALCVLAGGGIEVRLRLRIHGAFPRLFSLVF